MRHVVLLRGINLGAQRRVHMAELRALLQDAGFTEVRTYLQSGNVVVESSRKPASVEKETERLISERFGFAVPVVTRSARQLAAVVKRDPFGDIASDPKRYQVTFLAGKVTREMEKRLADLAAGSERLAVHGSEIYAWHPDGIGRSKLAIALAGKGLDVKATARNWKSVTALLEMASD